jgi:tRNA U34 5-methylaminomethyl-2-thiouridine-forming methyltransferase MnmC
VTDDGSRTLFDPLLGETFHSESGAAAEAKTVFVENSGLQHRLKRAVPIRVLEVGFGTGLNFLMAAEATYPSGGRLEYTGVDLRCLSPTVFQHLKFETVVSRPELVLAVQQLLERFSTSPSRPNGLQQDSITLDANLKLTLVIDDAVTFCGHLATQQCEFDVIFMDAFSPAATSELWSESFFETLFFLLKPGGVLTTYCVKSEIQRRLKKLGFIVKKRPGPVGGKREVLTAEKPAAGPAIS